MAIITRTSLVSALPDFARPGLTPLYEIYRSHRANFDHKPVLEPIRRKDDAPSHVLVIVIDALRPDFVPSMSLDFDHVIAPAPWTFPSVTSIHTGLRPSDHRSVAHTTKDDDEYAIPAQTTEYPLWPRCLEAAGYDTYAGCAFAMPFLALRGWYQTHRLRSKRAAAVLDDYRRWRQGRDRTAAYLHLADLHAPVNPPDEYVERYDVDRGLPELGYIRRYYNDFDEDDPECRYYREQKFRLHRATLEYVSEQLDRLHSEVQDDTLLVVTGDHGEAFWEHQDIDKQLTDPAWHYSFGHGGTPFDVVARVPLGIHNPSGDPPRPRGGWGSLRDIPATILESTVHGQEPPGQSWHHDIPSDRSVVCEGTRYGLERKAVYQNEYKLIRSDVYDVTVTAKVSDRGEVFVDIPEEIKRHLLDELPDSWDDMGTHGTVSAFTKDQLEALGYK